MKKVSSKQIIVFSVPLILAAAAPIGCTRMIASKSELMGQKVFTGSAGGTIGIGADGSGTLGQGSDGSGTPGQGGDGSQHPSQIPLQTLCSVDETNATGTSVTAAASVELVVKDSSNNTVCDVTKNVKQNIVNSKIIDLSACPLSGNSYQIQLFDPAHPGEDLLYGLIQGRVAVRDNWVSISRANAQSPWNITNYTSSSIDGLNSGSAPLPQLTASQGVAVLYGHQSAIFTSVTGPSVPLVQCDIVQSPLVVNMTPPDQVDKGLMLTSPANGVYFDILGANSTPTPHTKKKISWPHNPNYMFLTLPESGHVYGIDQLFGNNTALPNGTFAANGFLALAKFDSNGDGVIDANDPVFKDLRLWSDTNFDGVAQPEELHSLDEMNITEIDLKYDRRFFEQDAYGNQTKFRSTVTLKDGSLRIIFDLWFAVP